MLSIVHHIFHVGVDREVGRGQALYEDHTGGCKHQARCTETWECTGRWERGMLYTRTVQVEASIKPGVQRRKSGLGGGKGPSSIRGPYRWRQASGQVYRDVGVDREVGRGQALYEDHTGGGKHQARCTET